MPDRRRAELPGADGGAAHRADLDPAAPPRGAVRRPRRPGPRRHPPAHAAPARRRAASRPASPPASPSAASSAERLRLARPARGVGGGRLAGRSCSISCPTRSSRRCSPPRRRWGGSCARSAGCWASMPPARWRRLPGARDRRSPPPRRTRYQQRDQIQPGRIARGHARRDAARWTPGRSPGPRRGRVRTCPPARPLGACAGLGARV